MQHNWWLVILKSNEIPKYLHSENIMVVVVVSMASFIEFNCIKVESPFQMDGGNGGIVNYNVITHIGYLYNAKLPCNLFT